VKKKATTVIDSFGARGQGEVAELQGGLYAWGRRRSSDLGRPCGGKEGVAGKEGDGVR
jgi:hypothetical protein